MLPGVDPLPRQTQRRVLNSNARHLNARQTDRSQCFPAANPLTYARCGRGWGACVFMLEQQDRHCDAS